MALSIVAGLALTAEPAKAQVPDAQTGAASAGRAEEQFRAPDFAPKTVPKLEVKELAIKGAPEGADSIRFELNNIVLEGASSYDPAELASVYADRLGGTVTLTELYAIAADLTRKYRNDGYILTQVLVPPQTIEGGTARLQVIEGYIDNVEVRAGDKESQKSLDLIRAYASRVRTDAAAMNVKDLERAVLLINDLPGVTARSVLNPSPTQPGAADLVVIVERDPYDALVSADNFGSKFLGPLQLTGVGTLNSAMGNNESLGAHVVYASNSSAGHELAYISVNYDQPIWSHGTRLSLLGSYTHTKPGHTLDQFDVRGNSRFGEIKVTHPFIRSRTKNLSGRASFDFRNVDSQNNVEATRKDRIRAVRLGGRFDYIDTVLGGGFNMVDLQVAKGIEAFGSSNQGNPNQTRVQGDPSFVKLAGELQRLQRIRNGVNLLLAGRGQWSDSPLLSSEEFGVGGVSYGRGFDSSEIIGDEGVAGKIELQWNEPHKLSLLEDYQLYGFYDAGRIWNDDATANNQKTDTVTSAGAGIRADFTENTEAGFMFAFPLNRDVETEGDRNPRFFLSVSHRF